MNYYRRKAKRNKVKKVHQGLILHLATGGLLGEEAVKTQGLRGHPNGNALCKYIEALEEGRRSDVEYK